MSPGPDERCRALGHYAPRLGHALEERTIVDMRLQYESGEDAGHAYVALYTSSGSEHTCQSSAFDAVGAAAALATMLNRFVYEVELLESGDAVALRALDWPDEDVVDTHR
jgi:hypothetical protein